MVSRALAAAVAALSAAALLVGCASDDGSGSGTTPPATEMTDWAEGVCTASATVRESMRAIGDLTIDPSASATAADQVRQQADLLAATISESAAALEAQLAALPPGADPQLADAQKELDSAALQARTSLRQLAGAAAAVHEAPTAPEIAAALPPLKSAAALASENLETFFTALRGVFASGEQAVREAFGTAPTCAELAASTPSSSP